MSRPSLPRHGRPAGRVVLSAPPVMEGECPSSTCRGGPYELSATGQLPEHPVATRWTRNRRCPCSGWQARNPRPQSYLPVEGVHFL